MRLLTMPFASKTHRVYDETVPVSVRGRSTPFRVRIWMAQGRCPVVLVSSDPLAKQPPSWFTTRILNQLHRTLLHGATEFRYFEFTGSAHKGLRQQPTEVLFEHFELKSGSHHFVSASDRMIEWDELELLVGECVERA